MDLNAAMAGINFPYLIHEVIDLPGFCAGELVDVWSSPNLPAFVVGPVLQNFLQRHLIYSGIKLTDYRFLRKVSSTLIFCGQYGLITVVLPARFSVQKAQLAFIV